MVKNGVQLLVDPMSFQYLNGAEIDYQEGLEGRPVRDQESECTDYLRLRFVFLGLTTSCKAKKNERALAFSFFFMPGKLRPVCRDGGRR